MMIPCDNALLMVYLDESFYVSQNAKKCVSISV